MAKLVSMKKSKAEVKAERKSMSAGPGDGDREGPTFYLEDDDLKKLGLDGSLKNGDKITLSAEGYVQSASSSSSDRGERYSATLCLTRMGVDRASSKDDERKEVRGDIEKAYSAAKGKSAK